MAYGEESLVPLPITGYGNSELSKAATNDWGLLGYNCNAGSSGEVFAEMAIPYTRCKVKRVQMLVTTTFGSNTKIKVWKNAIADADLIVQFTPGTAAADSVIYLNIADTLLEAGDYVSWELSTADGSAGTLLPSVLVEPVSETAANISDMTTTGGSTTES